jgi:hypothetical protein
LNLIRGQKIMPKLGFSPPPLVASTLPRRGDIIEPIMHTYFLHQRRIIVYV